MAITVPTWTKPAFLLIVGIAWSFAVTMGFVVLWDYEAGPAPPGDPPARWPTASRLAPAKTRATLVMAAHPHCPCTRASIGELDVLMAHSAGRVDTYLLFYTPNGAPDGWERTDLWTRAEAIPGVHVVHDGGGLEAGRFGALASGQVMVYSASGELRFSGGITGSRGHAGDNAGRDAIIALLRHEPAARTVTAVFGCALRSPTESQSLDLAGPPLRHVFGRIGVLVGFEK